MTNPGGSDRRVVVVTGGGGGIGAAVAEELGRRGDHVVTVDPMVSLDGTAAGETAEATTADRIVAAGGSAQAAPVSVTDDAAFSALFGELVDRFGRIDAVVNVAGISRPTGFGRGSEEDWEAVLRVHLDGYLNVLRAALPVMAAQGRGHVLGVTSGSGWRAADAGAYSCAKRAVASLTWQLGRVAPDGVVVNAISPIAVTRMVTEALARAAAAGPTGGSASGGLSLGTMPEPEQIAPLAAHMVGEGFDALQGQVVFAGGSEVALVEPPKLLEVVRTSGVDGLGVVLDGVAGALAKAEVRQASTGGGNPRFDEVFEGHAAPAPASPEVRSCAVVGDAGAVAPIVAALEARGVSAVVVHGEQVGDVDAVVVARSDHVAATTDGWTGVLADHAGVADGILADAAWARAATEAGRPSRLVAVVDASSPGGRSRAQASTQLARAAPGATDGRLQAFTVAVDGASAASQAEVAAFLASSPEATELAGAELTLRDGWLGLSSHPRPRGDVVLGTSAIPAWFDDALREVAGG